MGALVHEEIMDIIHADDQWRIEEIDTGVSSFKDLSKEPIYPWWVKGYRA